MGVIKDVVTRWNFTVICQVLANIKRLHAQRKVKDLFKNIYFEADITWDIFYGKVF